MAGIGAESKWAVYKETAFRQPWVNEPQKRLALIDESISLNKNYTDPKELTGRRVALVKVPMKSESKGSIQILGAPENGFAELLSAVCGGYTTFAGAYRREFFVGDGTEHVLAAVPVTVSSDNVFIRTAPLAYEFQQWQQLTRVSGIPADGQYAIDGVTGTITFGEDVTAKQVLVTYCKMVTGVYTHVIAPGDVPYFGLWSTKGAVDLFEFQGCAMEGGDIESSSESFLGLKGNIVAAKQVVASVDTTGHTFNSALKLSGVSAFKMSQARVYIDYVLNARMSKISWNVANNLDPYWSLNCDPSITKIYPGIQVNTLGVDVVFDQMTEYVEYLREQFFSIEVEYGGCTTGVQIGTTGENYRMFLHFPRFRFEDAPLPVKPGKIMLAGKGQANLEPGMDKAYTAVIVNGQPLLWQ